MIVYTLTNDIAVLGDNFVYWVDEQIRVNKY